MNLDVYLRRADAARMAGVSVSTLKNWYDRGWVNPGGERRRLAVRRTGEGRGVLTYRLGDVLDAARDTGVNPRSPGRSARVTVVGGEAEAPVRRRAWEDSTRAEHLPSNWDELRVAALRRNPRKVCHLCGLPGGSDLDHKNGDRYDNRLENLDWAHNRADYEAGRSERNCHGEKSSAEGNAARVSRFRPKEKHPGLL